MDGKKIGAVVVIVLFIIGIFAFNSYQQDNLVKENNAKELKEKQIVEEQEQTALAQAQKQEQKLQKEEEELRVLEEQKQNKIAEELAVKQLEEAKIAKLNELAIKEAEDAKIAKLNEFKSTTFTFNFDSNSVVLNDTQELKDFLLGVDLLDKTNLLNKIVIDAYADNIGLERYNLILSSKRADALKDKLSKYKIELDAKANGENSPIASNNTKEGRALNRRIEVRIY